MKQATFERMRRAGISVDSCDPARHAANQQASRDFVAKRKEQHGKPDAEKIADARKRRLRMREARIRAKAVPA